MSFPSAAACMRTEKEQVQDLYKIQYESGLFLAVLSTGDECTTAVQPGD